MKKPVEYEEEDVDMDDEGMSEEDVDEEDDEFLDEHDDFDLSSMAPAKPTPTKRTLTKSEPAKPVKRKSTSTLKTTVKKPKVKPPSAEELIHLRETENLYQSNLFRLQLEEMLKEVKPDKKVAKAARKWVNDFTAFLADVEDGHKEYPLDQRKWLSKFGVEFPLSVEGEHEGVFQFFKPTKVMTVGSLPNNTITGPHFTIDIVVVMQKRMFKKSDKFNHKYFIKRALYLCHLAHLISKSDFVSEESQIKFWSKQFDLMKPSLVLRPNGVLSQAFEVIITAIPTEGTFKPTQFTPEQCNLPDPTGESLPTPYYNASMLEDIVTEENENKKTAVFNYPEMKNAIQLLKVWLTKRGLIDGYGAFNVHIMSMHLVYLFTQEKITRLMSSYQIVRNVWLNLSKADWVDNGDSLCHNFCPDAPATSQFHTHHQVVFVDASGFHNLAFRMVKATFDKVKSEAGLAIEYLNSREINGFQVIFMRDVPFLLQYDHLISFPDFEIINKVAKNHSSPHRMKDTCNHSLHMFYEVVLSVLGKGLGNRIRAVGLKLLESPRWSTNEKCDNSNWDDVLIGLTLNPETALGVIDKGPPANLPEAADFQKFWGNKSELRRFKDGTVCESVVWMPSSAPMIRRRSLVTKIVRYLFKHKLHLRPSDVIIPQMNKVFTNRQFPSFTLEESTRLIHKSFEVLSQQLRDLNDLPLSVADVECISPVYRFTEVTPPVNEVFLSGGASVKTSKGYMLNLSKKQCSLPRYIQPIDVVLQLTTSSKWPSDLKAGKRLVAAFNIAIADALSKNYKYPTQVTANEVTVLKDGYVFRLQLAFEKEIVILKRQITTDGVLRYRDTPESIAFEKKFINLPQLSGFLFGLSQAYTGYGATVVLAKRWISSQLIPDKLFPSILIEILVAHLFVSPAPFQTVSQPLPGFLKFLHLLAKTDWHAEPIIVNFNGLLSRAQVVEMESSFTKNRDDLPPMYVATPFDRTGTLWTKDAPTLPTLVRLAKLASTSLSILQVLLTTGSKIEETLSIFNAPLNIYDAVIHLKPSVVTRSYESLSFPINEVFRAPSELPPQSTVVPVAGFDPVELYVKDLEENYSEFALFFYNVYGGSSIGVLFKPDYLNNPTFKANSIGGRKPVNVDGKVELRAHKESIIEGFRVLGTGLIDKIDVK